MRRNEINPRPKAATSEADCARPRAAALPRRGDRPRRIARKAIVKALNVVPEGIYFLNADLRVVDANAAAARDTGYRRAELRNLRVDEVLADDGTQPLRGELERLLRHQSAAGTLRAQQRIKGGGWRPVHVQLQCVDAAEQLLIVAVVRGAGEQRDRRKSRSTHRDYLTALPARRALERRLRRAEQRSQRRGTRFAVLFLDLDGFKGVNDTGGHRVGDLVLRIVGQRLQSSVRPGDFVARYGGDEFVALIEDVGSRREVDEIAERIRDALSAPIDACGSRFCLSASIGVAIGRAFQSAAEILDAADRAMYRTKRGHAPHGPHGPHNHGNGRR